MKNLVLTMVQLIVQHSFSSIFPAFTISSVTEENGMGDSYYSYCDVLGLVCCPLLGWVLRGGLLFPDINI